MRKLEMRELAAYSPYELVMMNIKNWHKIYVIGIQENAECLKIISGPSTYNLDFWSLKPLLIPLSDLLHLGDGNETHLICNIVDESEHHCDVYDKWLDSYLDNPDPCRILQAPYEIVQELLKRHFDIFGLIPDGLALNKLDFPTP